MALRALGQYRGPKYDIDEDYGQARLPLMNHITQPPQYAVGGGPQNASIQ